MISEVYVSARGAAEDANGRKISLLDTSGSKHILIFQSIVRGLNSFIDWIYCSQLQLEWTIATCERNMLILIVLLPWYNTY